MEWQKHECKACKYWTNEYTEEEKDKDGNPVTVWKGSCQNPERRDLNLAHLADRSQNDTCCFLGK